MFRFFFLYCNDFHERALVFQDIVDCYWNHILPCTVDQREGLAARPPSLGPGPVHVATLLIDIPSHQCFVVGADQGLGARGWQPISLGCVVHQIAPVEVVSVSGGR